jgi:lipid-binding SYLF domain-containing protein
MIQWTRRSILLGGSATALAACSTGTASKARYRIDANVEAALRQMEDEYPFTRTLVDQSSGMLVMPKITKAGFMVGGTYGEGALLIGNAPVDYYSVVGASFGLQIGAQQLASVLFFMNDTVLRTFRERAGWTLGADLEYAILDKADSVGIDTNTQKDPIYAIVFGQAGLIVGATLEGSKYSRIIR